MPLLVGELYALLVLEKKAFMRGLKEAEAAGAATAGSLKASFLAAGKVIALGLAGLVVGLGAVGVASLNASQDFEKGMASVQTLIGKGSAADKRVAELGDSVKEMSKVTGMSLKDLTDGLYGVIGTFTDTADSAKWLEISAKAGAAGLSTTKEALLLLSAVTKSYGDESIEAAQKAADLVFETANLGVTTFPEMAASMGKVLPLSAQLKVSQEELFGAMAALTGVTGDTAIVTTQLRSIMSAFLKPNTLMNKAIEETGYQSGEAMVQALGLSGAMKLIGGTATVGEKGIAKVFGRVEALTAVLALNGAQADDWVWKTEAMRKSAGRTERAFAIQQATAAAMVDRIGAALGVLAVEIGDKLMPHWKTFLAWVEKNMPKIEEMVLGAVDGIIAAVGVLASVLGSIVGAFSTFWDALGQMEMQGPVVAAVLLAIAAAFGVWAVSAAAAAVATIIAFAPVLITIGLIAVAIFAITKVFEHFGITIEDVVGGVRKALSLLALGFLTLLEAAVNVMAFLPGPFQEAAKSIQGSLAQMKIDVQKWGDETGTVAYDAGHKAATSIVSGLDDGEVVDAYDKTGKSAANALLSGVSGGIEEGMTFSEAQLEDLGISMDEALAAGINVGEPMVTEATVSLVDQFGYTLSGVKDAALEAGGAAMAEMAKAITAHRTEAIDSMTALVELMKTSLTPLKEAGKLAGNLASKALHKALKDNRPDVVAQATATVKLTTDRLTELALGGGKAGRKAMQALRKGMKDKDPEIRSAAKHAMKVVETQLEKNKQIANEARRLGSRAASALKGGFGTPSLTALINIRGGGHDNRAVGGPIDPGKVYRVGENGPEWFVSSEAGRIIPHGLGLSADAYLPAAPPPRTPGSSSAPASQVVHNNLTVQGLVKARDPFEIVTQMRRLQHFGRLPTQTSGAGSGG